MPFPSHAELANRRETSVRLLRELPGPDVSTEEPFSHDEGV